MQDAPAFDVRAFDVVPPWEASAPPQKKRRKEKKESREKKSKKEKKEKQSNAEEPPSFEALTLPKCTAVKSKLRWLPPGEELDLSAFLGKTSAIGGSVPGGGPGTTSHGTLPPAGSWCGSPPTWGAKLAAAEEGRRPAGHQAAADDIPGGETQAQLETASERAQEFPVPRLTPCGQDDGPITEPPLAAAAPDPAAVDSENATERAARESSVPRLTPCSEDEGLIAEAEPPLAAAVPDAQQSSCPAAVDSENATERAARESSVPRLTPCSEDEGPIAEAEPPLAAAGPDAQQSSCPVAVDSENATECAALKDTAPATDPATVVGSSPRERTTSLDELRADKHELALKSLIISEQCQKLLESVRSASTVSDEQAAFYRQTLASFFEVARKQARQIEETQGAVAELSVELIERQRLWQLQREEHQEWLNAQQRKMQTCEAQLQRLGNLMRVDVRATLPSPASEEQGALILLAACRAAGSQGPDELAKSLRLQHQHLQALASAPH